MVNFDQNVSAEEKMDASAIHPSEVIWVKEVASAAEGFACARILRERMCTLPLVANSIITNFSFLLSLPVRNSCLVVTMIHVCSGE